MIKGLMALFDASAEESLPAASDFIVSAELIGGNVWGLFSESRLCAWATRLLQAETEVDVCKKTIMRHAKNLDCSQVLRALEKADAAHMQLIGAEFFYATSKKFAKNQSIENYAKFLFHMVRCFGFDVHFVKNFFFGDRDEVEVRALLGHMQEWRGLPAEEHHYILAKTFAMSLEKLASQAKVADFFTVLEAHAPLMRLSAKLDVQKTFQKLLINLVQNVLFKIEGREWFRECFERFVRLGFEFNEFLFNKILDMVNKNLSDDSLIDFLVGYMRGLGVQPNVVTYNTIMDFYSMRGDFEKAQAVFRELGAQGIAPDNFTFSILIKGIKNMKEPSLAVAQEFYALYKSSAECKDIIMYNSLLDVFISLGDIGMAHEVYAELLRHPEHAPDQITYNTLIKGCCRAKDFPHALRYFGEMRARDLKPNRITYNSLMDLAVKLQDLANCLFFVEEMQKDEIAPDGYTYSIMLNGLKQNASPPELVRECLENIRRVVEAGEFKLDEVFFNSVLDVCAKYELFAQFRFFYDLMRAKHIAESAVTYGIVIKVYGKTGEFEKAHEIFDRMVRTHMSINDVTYGCILDACSKSGHMDVAFKIYESLDQTKLNLNSIVFTTMLKGFIKLERYDDAVAFFERVKHHTALTGMIITFNCALDVYVRKGELDKALALFNEIDRVFKADLISYSTIIKGLCTRENKQDALEYLKRMINSGIEIDISVVNLFLDHCANPSDFKLGIQGYQYSQLKNIAPNEITFGIMVKIYGFSRELFKAFDLLDLMAAYHIAPSIIIFTNLVHISFYNKNPKKAELAFTLFKKTGAKGDKLLYSKLIEGLLRFGEEAKVQKYVDHCVTDECGLKPEVIDKVRETLDENESLNAALRQIEGFLRAEKHKKVDPNLHKPRYNTKNDNPSQFKKIIHEQNRQEALAEQARQKTLKKETQNIKENPAAARKVMASVPAPKEAPREWKKTEKDTFFKSDAKKPLTLFNFRDKKPASS